MTGVQKYVQASELGHRTVTVRCPQLDRLWLRFWMPDCERPANCCGWAEPGWDVSRNLETSILRDRECSFWIHVENDYPPSGHGAAGSTHCLLGYPTNLSDVDFEKKTASVTFDPDKASPDTLTKATSDAGYPSTVHN
jgi:hypothetical protein